jgi:DNA-binding MarR family transcriptional regulator
MCMHDTPLARLLLERFRWFDESLRAALAERLGVDITSAQSLLFADLHDEGVRQVDIARSLGVSRQAVNELVRGLEGQGLVEVHPDPADGRAKLVRPSSSGRRSITVALDVFDELEARLGARIGEAAVDELRAILAAAESTAAPRDGRRGPALRSGRGTRNARDASP